MMHAADREYSERRRPPGWVAVADVAVLLLLAAAASIALFGGFRVYLGAVVTGHSALRLLVAAGLVAAARHYFVRSPNLPSRLAAALRDFSRRESVRAIAPPFVWSRAGVFLIGYLAIGTVGLVERIPYRLSSNEFANLPARWDAGWYTEIAANGYRYDPGLVGRQQNVAFFPAFPLTIRVAGILSGGHVEGREARIPNALRLTWTGVLVNLGALAGALGYLYRMVRQAAGTETAAAAVQFALAYPMALYFNAPYSEGLFLLSVLAVFYHFGRAQLGAAALWGLLAGLSRPNGFLLCVPLGLIALARSGPVPRVLPLIDRLNVPERRPGLVRDLAAALAPAAGMLTYSLFLYANWGSLLLWSRLHAAWGRTYQGLDPALRPLDAIAETGLAFYTSTAGFEVLHVLFFCFAVALSIPIAWRLGVAYTLLILLTLVPPLVAGGWLSMSRFTVVLFPLYVYLGMSVPARHRLPMLVVFAMLQGLGAALFFTWRSLF